jgi:tetratricopeptide (TPR) repeat protein
MKNTPKTLLLFPIHTLIAGILILSVLPAMGQETAEKPPAEKKMDDAFSALENAQNIDSGAPGAEQALKEAILLDPSLERAYYNLAILYFHTHRIREALSLLETTIASQPSFGDCLGLMAWITSHADPTNTAKIELLYEQALKVAPLNSFANNRLSAAALEAGDWGKARTHARKALAGNPDSINAYHNLAAAYYNLEKHDLARLVCENGLNKDEESATLYNMLGLIKIKQDDVKGALASFNRALKSDPNLVEALMNAGAVTLGYNDFAVAKRMFERAAELTPGAFAAPLSLAVALTGLKSYAEAKSIYEEILKNDTKQLAAHYNLCVLLNEHLNDYKNALSQCSNYDALLPPAHEKKEEMKRRLEGIQLLMEE